MLKSTNSTIPDARPDDSGALIMIAAIGLLAAAAIFSALKRRMTRAHEFARADQRVDKGLRDTFPASDPPAPHYVDIPVNRR